MIGFIIGFFIGFWFGFFLAAVLVAAAEEEEAREWERRIINGEDYHADD